MTKQIQPDHRSDDVSHLCQPVQLKTTDLDKDVNENIRSIFDSNIKLYKTITFRGIRYTTVTYQTRGQKYKSYVLYKMAKTTGAGFITSIIQTNPDETNCVIQIRDAPINRYLDIYLSGIQIGCSTVMFSNANHKHSSFFGRPTDILKKLSYIFDNVSNFFILFRFPNMIESS